MIAFILDLAFDLVFRVVKLVALAFTSIPERGPKG